MKYKFEMFKNLKLKIWVIGLLVYWFIGLLSPKAMAQSSSNNNYDIDVQNIDINPQNNLLPTPQILINQTPTPTIPQEPKSIIDNSFLSISLDNDFIDFGTLSPGNPVTRNAVLAVKSNSDYQVISFEDHPPQNKESVIIPDTTCEDGQCSETTESIWKNNLTYGFGYRCDDIEGSDCISFSEGDFYRQLADIRKKKPKETMSGFGDTAIKKARLTFKLNAPGTQKPGNYSSNLTFIAVPNY